jgi:uncharacterized protein (TIGR02646 family)
MIHINRDRVPIPEVLTSDWAGEADAELWKSFQKQKDGRQEGFPFRPRVWQATADSLMDLFHGKCAYCESPMDQEEYVNVDHFRPKAIYWWLAYDWTNLYPVCPLCARYKGVSFPVLRDRAQPGQTGADLLDERALLLDPCLDQPSEWLHFGDKGKVHSTQAAGVDKVTFYEEYDRGGVTIDLLFLNRAQLEQARHHAIIRAKRRWSEVLAMPADEFPERTRDRLAKMIGDAEPYAAAVRQYLARRIHELDGAVEEAVDPRLVSLRKVAPEVSDLAAQVGALEIQPAAVAKTLDREQGGLRSTYIESIDLTNFKCFQKLKLTLETLRRKPPSPLEEIGLLGEGGAEQVPDSVLQQVAESDAGESRAGWLAALGENASGKTTLLEAVGLALSPQTALDKLEDLGRFVRHDRRVAWVRLKLARAECPEIALRITSKGGFEFRKGEPPADTVIRGYGFVRLLARRAAGAPQPERLNRLDNLFDPRAPLCDVEGWLLDLFNEDPDAFRLAATTIKRVLPEEHVPDLVPTEDGKGIEIELEGESYSLQELSGGYQSALSLAADIMSGIPLDQMLDLRAVPGIVLVDEIGTQLHPRWRMRIVNRLREAFPMMQFIISTHEPLCLRGLEAPEVVVVQRQEPSLITFDSETASPARMRVDQLLTSRFFGLDSTIDPEIDTVFQYYYYLLAKEDRTEEEEEQCRELRRRLWGYGILGHTRRDQIVYELIDEWLAAQQFRDPQEQRVTVEKLPTEVRSKVFDMWEYAKLRQEGSP